jgi:hypothetical protein
MDSNRMGHACSLNAENEPKQKIAEADLHPCHERFAARLWSRVSSCAGKCARSAALLSSTTRRHRRPA